MRKTVKSKIYRVGSIIAGLVLISLLTYLYTTRDAKNAADSDSQEPEKPYIVPALTKTYTNTIYSFSLKTPEDFSVRESLIDGVTTIVFENAKAEGIQMSISKFDERELKVKSGIKIFDKEYVQTNLPDLRILDDQPIEIGSGYRGLAFKSDNDAFNGSSREVWFVFRGNLYQISTYDRFDELLKEMFATWKFN